jgi:thioredoxin 1
VVELTEANWQQEVAEADRPVLVFFWAPWSGPDRLLLPVLQQLAAHFAGKVRFGRLNVDEEPELAIRYNLTTVPTILLFKGGVQPVQRIIGLRPQAELARALYRLID